MVCVDDSPTSAAAIAFAADEAARRGAELVALHAWNGYSSTELHDSLHTAGEPWSGDADEGRILAEALAGVSRHYPNVPVRRRVTCRSARRELVSRSWTAQLVVVGDSGRLSLARLLLGAVSRHVLRHAACPAGTRLTW